MSGNIIRTKSANGGYLVEKNAPTMIYPYLVMVDDDHQFVSQAQKDKLNALGLGSPISSSITGDYVVSVNGKSGSVALTLISSSLQLLNDANFQTATQVSSSVSTKLDTSVYNTNRNTDISSSLNLIRNGVPGAGDDLNKIYILLQSKQTSLTGSASQYRKGDNSVGTFATDVRNLFTVTGSANYDPATGIITVTAPSASVSINASDLVGILPDNKLSSNVTLNSATQSLSNKTLISPLGITKNDVGLNLVDNTPDSTKPISTPVSASLALKASLVHTHSIADVNTLQSVLDSKAVLVHTHSISDVTGLSTSLSSKANTIHTHSISDVTNLQTSLDGKANTVHTHSMADVTGLTTLSSSFASVSASVITKVPQARTITINGNTQDLTTDISFSIAVSGSVSVNSVNGKSGSVTLTKTDIGLSVVPNIDATQRASHTGSQLSSTISDFSASVAALTPVQSVNSKTGSVILNKSDVGLSAVPNIDATQRANHSGSQPASTITGLATVATSSLYSDLTGRPTTVSSFTNDSGYQTASQVSASIAPISASLTSVSSSLNTTITNVTNLTSTVNNVSSSLVQDIINLSNVSSSVVSLQSTVAGKANTIHTHSISDVTNLQTTLNGKANTIHTHSVSDITSGVFAPTYLGTGTPASGKYLDGTGAWLTLPTASGSSGSGTSQPGLIVVSTLTATGLQTAINNAPSGSTITWTGTIDLNADITIQNKTNLTIEGFGQAKLTRSDSANMIAIRGGIIDVKIQGIELVNTCTTGSIAMIFSNQEGTVTGLTIERCGFTNNSLAGTNAISLNCVGGGNSEFVVQYKNLHVRNNRFNNIGRMAIEILNHAWDGSGPQLVTENVTVTDNYFNNIGTGNTYGMAISISGFHRYVKMSRNMIYDAKYTSLEVIGGDQIIVTDNFIKDINNTSTAIVISDGYKNGTSGFVKNMEIANNFSDTKGRALVLYYGTNVTYSNNTSISPINIDIKSNECTLIGNNITVTASNNAVVFDNASRNTVTGNVISMYPTTIAASGTAALINLKAGSNNNIVLTNTLIRKTGAVYVHIETNASTSGNLTGAAANSSTNSYNNYIDKA